MNAHQSTSSNPKQAKHEGEDGGHEEGKDADKDEDEESMARASVAVWIQAAPVQAKFRQRPPCWDGRAPVDPAAT